MSSNSSQPKCRHCGRRFCPDPRNRFHQKYCSEPTCRWASKLASQRQWLNQAQNRDYFSGKEQTRRVQQWRKANPGYWKKKDSAARTKRPLDRRRNGGTQKSCNALGKDGPLQDVCLERSPLLIGLLSMVSGCALQEDIEAIMDNLIIQGRKILRRQPPDQFDLKTHIDNDRRNFSTTRSPAATFDRNEGDALQSFLPGLMLYE